MTLLKPACCGPPCAPRANQLEQVVLHPQPRGTGTVPSVAGQQLGVCDGLLAELVLPADSVALVGAVQPLVHLAQRAQPGCIAAPHGQRLRLLVCACREHALAPQPVTVASRSKHQLVPGRVPEHVPGCSPPHVLEQRSAARHVELRRDHRHAAPARGDGVDGEREERVAHRVVAGHLLEQAARGQAGAQQVVGARGALVDDVAAGALQHGRLVRGATSQAQHRARGVLRCCHASRHLKSAHHPGREAAILQQSSSKN
mmetsp:Transcript_36438/g.92007  ORF Transcript_36438/g.92007 Transcript_36438/m.92007 type:complete len:258 (+) Transcript_36438:27-800(+)